MKPFFALANCTVAMVTLLVAVSCTEKVVTVPPASDGSSTEPGACDPAKCAAKNECIPDPTGVVACRLPCQTQSECPFGYACQAHDDPSVPYCVKLGFEIAQKPTGQWGTPCLPKGGLKANPACDAETGFGCYGTGTTDANAYCTRFDCADDTECAGGYFCAKVNVGPSVTSDVRTFGKTRSVCARRTYCSPCASDVDCPKIDGVQGRCAEEDHPKGTPPGAKYCTTPCSSAANCRLDASCTRILGDGTKVCRPRAGTCKGDGSLCSPCRSDADCTNGFCVRGPYSPETFCSVKSTTTCVADGKATLVKGGCPGFTKSAGTRIYCQASDADPTIPKDQCIGLVDFGESGDVGCYTNHPVTP